MYVARLRGARVRRGDVGGAGNLGGESETILEEGGMRVLMVEIAIGDSQRLGRAVVVAVDLVGKW
jgi:hypothetical protein